MKNKKTTERKTLSFSQQNLDVLEILDEKANASQYVCDAIRFYEKYKDRDDNLAISEQDIENIVDSRIASFLMKHGVLVEPSKEEPYTIDKTEKKEIEENNEKPVKDHKPFNISDINQKTLNSVKKFQGK